MKRKARLRTRRDFQHAMNARSRAGRHLICYQRPAAGLRVGVTVSRQVRGAVRRNRLKRRLREVARHVLIETGVEGDIVLIGRVSAELAPIRELEEELTRLVAKPR